MEQQKRKRKYSKKHRKKQKKLRNFVPSTKEECMVELKRLFNHHGGVDGGGEIVLFGKWLKANHSTFLNRMRNCHKIHLGKVAKKWGVSSKLHKLKVDAAHVNVKKYTDKELVKIVKRLYEKDGIEVLSTEYIKQCKIPKNNFPRQNVRLETALNLVNLNISKIASRLNLTEELKKWKNEKMKWTLDFFLKTTEKILHKYGYIPHRSILKSDGVGCYQTYMRKFGYSISDIYSKYETPRMKFV